MIDKKIFEKFNLLPFSPSRLNSFKNFPCGFVLRYIYEYDFPANEKMIRGSSIEHGIHYYLANQNEKAELVDNINQTLYEEAKRSMFNYYDDGTKFVLDQDKAEKERSMLEPSFDIALNCLLDENITFKGSDYVTSQMEVSTEILGIPFRGFVDFVFESDQLVTVIDLKSKSRLMKSRSDILQQAIYKKALREKYKDKAVDVSMLIVTPKKYEVVDILNTEKEMKEIEMSLISLANMMKICKTKDNIASLITPNLDDWNWSDKDKVLAREEIWGI
jgi:hypothetical protein